MRLPSVTIPNFCIPSLVIALEPLTVGNGSGARSQTASAATITTAATPTAPHFIKRVRVSAFASAAPGTVAVPLCAVTPDECAFTDPEDPAVSAAPLPIGAVPLVPE